MEKRVYNWRTTARISYGNIPILDYGTHPHIENFKTTDPKLRMIFDEYKKMNTSKYWAKLVDEYNDTLNTSDLPEDALTKLKLKLIRALERKKLIFSAYSDIVNRPHDMKDSLKKLNSTLRAFDKKCADKSEQLKL